MSTFQRGSDRRRGWYFSSRTQRHQCRDHEEEKMVHASRWKNGQTGTDSNGTQSKQFQKDGQND